MERIYTHVIFTSLEYFPGYTEFEVTLDFVPKRPRPNLSRTWFVEPTVTCICTNIRPTCPTSYWTCTRYRWLNPRDYAAVTLS